MNGRGYHSGFGPPMTPPVIKSLLIANCLVFVAQLLTEPGGIVTRLGVVSPAAVWFNFELWRPFTYMWLHSAGYRLPLHLLFNMLALFFFGPRLEMHLGGRSFLALYFLSGLGGALLSFIPPLVPVVGASGAVFGVLLGFAYFWPKERIYIWAIIPVEARVLVGVMTAVSLWSGLRGGGGGDVAHLAHLGGFAAGYLYLRWRKRKHFRQWKPMPTPRAQMVKSALKGDDRAALKKWKTIQLEELHELNRGEVERLLDKAAQSGAGSLTPDERAMLDRFSSAN